MCCLSLIHQVLLVSTCHFKLKKAYGIAIQTQNFRKKKLSKSLLYRILSAIYDKKKKALKPSCPKIVTAYQVVKVRLKWYKIDSNDK